MRIGLLGPTDDEEALREATSFLLGDADAEQVIFLGEAAFLERAIAHWATDLGLGGGTTFLDRALAASLAENPRALDEFLTADLYARRLLDVRRLPDSPARAVEFMDDRIVLFVRDKSVLDEEDIANANLIVYATAPESQLHKFGRRAFFSPGPLSAGRVGVIESSEEGFSIAVYDVSGMPILRESLANAVTKVMVSS
jgi:hypothetical protein